MREREQLSYGEQQYISSKLTGWKITTFFLPGLVQIRCKRWGLFWGGALISCGLLLLGYAAGDATAVSGAGYIGWIINVILTWIGFTEKAYRHDMPYFQRYLDAYAKLHGGNSRTNRKNNNVYEEECDEDDDNDNELKYTCGNCGCDVNGNVKKCPNCGAKFLDEDKEKPRKRIRENISNQNNNYDKFGFDREGYNREGYDAYGFDRDGFNRKGYNEEGFDKNGFDKEGYNYKGYDRDGYDREGYNKRGFNRNGIDKDGYDEYGDKKKGIKKASFKKVNTKKTNVRK